MIRTAAAIVAVLALVVVAWSAYRVAEAEEEQACLAWISATADEDLAVMEAAEQFGLTFGAESGASFEDRQQRWKEKATAFNNLFDVCKAL